MAVLPNARHEKFAQEIAKGLSSREAYKLAGYEAKSDAAADASASRLLSNVKIAARVKELQSRGAERAELTVQKLLDELEEARQLAKELMQPNAMVAASMGRAKVSGKIVDRKEIGDPGDFARLSDDELNAEYEAVISELELSPASTKH